MSQSLSNIIIHTIFSTKTRLPYIDKLIQGELYAYLTSILSAKGSYVYKIGGVSDHVHILSTLPRTIDISDLLEDMKKNSSKWIKTKGQNYRDFSWQKGYGVFSVSESLRKVVENYIANQEEHHQKHTFQDEYREFLRLNNIPFDERYLWD